MLIFSLISLGCFTASLSVPDSSHQRLRTVESGSRVCDIIKKAFAFYLIPGSLIVGFSGEGHNHVNIRTRPTSFTYQCCLCYSPVFFAYKKMSQSQQRSYTFKSLKGTEAKTGCLILKSRDGRTEIQQILLQEAWTHIIFRLQGKNKLLPKVRDMACWEEQELRHVVYVGDV